MAISAVYTRLQTVWSLPGPSRQYNKGHSPRCHRRPNGPGRLADKVVQPTTQSAEGCTWAGPVVAWYCLSGISSEAQHFRYVSSTCMLLPRRIEAYLGSFVSLRAQGEPWRVVG